MDEIIEYPPQKRTIFMSPGYGMSICKKAILYLPKTIFVKSKKGKLNIYYEHNGFLYSYAYYMPNMTIEGVCLNQKCNDIHQAINAFWNTVFILRNELIMEDDKWWEKEYGYITTIDKQLSQESQEYILSKLEFVHGSIIESLIKNNKWHCLKNDKFDHQDAIILSIRFNKKNIFKQLIGNQKIDHSKVLQYLLVCNQIDYVDSTTQYMTSDEIQKILTQNMKLIFNKTLIKTLTKVKTNDLYKLIKIMQEKRLYDLEEKARNILGWRWFKSLWSWK